MEGGQQKGRLLYKLHLTVANANETIIDPKSYVGKFRSDEWSELHTKAVQSKNPAAGAKQPVVEVEVRYRDPAAGEVRLVWGLDNFTSRPCRSAPETFLTFNGSHINTPMQCSKGTSSFPA